MTYVWIGFASAVLLVVGLAFYYGRKSGREAQRVGDLIKNDEVQDAQLKISTEPHDPAAIADRLRRHGF